MTIGVRNSHASIGFDAGELFRDFIEIDSCFEPVRVKDEGPLGRL